MTERTTDSSDQAETLAFLADPATHGLAGGEVDRIDTHSASVFLAGPWVYKVKRAVRFDFLDFSTLERRHAMCRRELERNRPAAPEIYQDIVAVTREADGGLALGGEGAPVEWAVRMHRFDQEALLSALAKAGRIDAALTARLAATVARYHSEADPVSGVDGAARMRGVVDELRSAFEAPDDPLPEQTAARFAALAEDRFAQARACLDRRAAGGCVRLCHGDLHLDNIVVLERGPVLFDAIEFNDEIAEIDTLYDLAFLLMDLDEHGLRAQANLLLNRYIWRRDRDDDLSGLAALPLFLGCRAGIRAMVALKRAERAKEADAGADVALAGEYLDAACAYLAPPEPRLVAVGGFSGTGKSTLSAALAPALGAVPGAVHLRSDVERKTMFGAAETERLPDSAYTEDAGAAVYERLAGKAELALEAGRTVVLDAVFDTPERRAAARRIAERLGVAFDGLWLTAPEAVLKARVGARTGDASDATASVVDAQLRRGPGEVSWHRIDAGGTQAATLGHARGALGA